jgi:ATP-binding cassette subfamily B protein
LQGQVTLGDLALFYQAFNRGQTLVRDLLGNVGQVYTNSLFLGSLFEFLKLKLHNSETAKLLPLSVPIKKGICLRQVSFGYPGSKRAVLENFDLTIPAGKITAIVGDNGAGKSTLVKLLCRLYDPDSGSVELDGTDIRKLDVNEFRRNLSVLFQFPVNYYETAAQCISFGDLSASRREIETAAKGAGTHEILARLPQGYDTILGKWFDEGVNLSGGELQRVALARAFLRTKAQFIILDEPTSAMDPWAEHDWLSRFRTMANGRTAVVITHRFTLAMRADIIHVMRDGKIIESGNHDQLLAQDGFYAQSWNAQMQVSSSKSVESGIV